MEQLLSGFPVNLTIPVQWGEMDAYGHVNNTVFFRYFESARIDYLDRCGFLESAEQTGVGVILHSTSCRFRLPLFYPDVVAVGGRVRQISDDRFDMEYRVVSQSAQAVAAEGSGLVVCYDYNKREKTAIPDSIVARMRELQPGSAI